MPPRRTSTKDRLRKEARVYDGLSNALARLVRWEADASPEGRLPELLRTWRAAKAFRAGLDEGPRAGAAGTVADWLLGAVADELRREVRREAGNPPEHQPAAAWAEGGIVVALPASAAERNPEDAFLVIEALGRDNSSFPG